MSLLKQPTTRAGCQKQKVLLPGYGIAATLRGEEFIDAYVHLLCMPIGRVGQTLYIRCKHGIFGRGTTNCTVYTFGSGRP
jgi:hypothetical protein